MKVVGAVIIGLVGGILALVLVVCIRALWELTRGS